MSRFRADAYGRGRSRLARHTNHRDLGFAANTASGSADLAAGPTSNICPSETKPMSAPAVSLTRGSWTSRCDARKPMSRAARAACTGKRTVSTPFAIGAGTRSVIVLPDPRHPLASLAWCRDAADCRWAARRCALRHAGHPLAHHPRGAYRLPQVQREVVSRNRTLDTFVDASWSLRASPTRKPLIRSIAARPIDWSRSIRIGASSTRFFICAIAVLHTPMPEASWLVDEPFACCLRNALSPRDISDKEGPGGAGPEIEKPTAVRSSAARTARDDRAARRFESKRRGRARSDIVRSPAPILCSCCRIAARRDTEWRRKAQKVLALRHAFIGFYRERRLPPAGTRPPESSEGADLELRRATHRATTPYRGSQRAALQTVRLHDLPARNPITAHPRWTRCHAHAWNHRLLSTR